MKHIAIDQQNEQVREFIRNLRIEPDGVELELEGRVICKVIAPERLSDEEIDAVLERGWDLIEKARARNKGVPTKVIEREVGQTVQDVRRRRQQE